MTTLVPNQEQEETTMNQNTMIPTINYDLNIWKTKTYHIFQHLTRRSPIPLFQLIQYTLQTDFDDIIPWRLGLSVV